MNQSERSAIQEIQEDFIKDFELNERTESSFIQNGILNDDEIEQLRKITNRKQQNELMFTFLKDSDNENTYTLFKDILKLDFSWLYDKLPDCRTEDTDGTSAVQPQPRPDLNSSCFRKFARHERVQVKRKELAKCLGVETEIGYLDCKYNSDFEEWTYQLFLKWKQVRPTECHFDRLDKALREARLTGVRDEIFNSGAK